MRNDRNQFYMVEQMMAEWQSPELEGFDRKENRDGVENDLVDGGWETEYHSCGYEYLDHPADVQLHSWGQDLKSAFEQCAIALFGVMTSLDTVDPIQVLAIDASGHDLESLLYNFLDECLFAFSAEPFLCACMVRINDMDLESFSLRATLSGEPFDLDKHPQGTEIVRSNVRLCKDNAKQVIDMDEIGSGFKDTGCKADAQSLGDTGFDNLNGCAKEQIHSKAEDEKVDEILSEEVKQQRREEALVLKEQGNTEFKNGNYGIAMETYGKALEVCPQCFKKDIAVLFSNRAACYVKSGENKAAIQDCTSALEYDAYYIKARLRRAQTYETCEKLDEALEDYKEVLKFDRSCQAAGEAVLRLPEQINQRNEKLKTEMMGKLKDLGNMCLRPFGLSTDNFKMQQDPNTGGYSISFQR